MSSLTVEEDQKWVPTHVQVTVLRGRGLRGKGKHGTSDVYTIIQVGKEKYSTGVAEKTTEPEWREECSFELQPGVLQSYPAGSNELVLTVMHRALIGLDVFLGQAVVQLDKVFSETRCVKNEWYRLNSKTGKKEKERGEIQVTVQFTRNNLTASMYDLVMKDKSASTFGKLKERMRGKRRSSDDDSSSAVVPSGYGSLHKMRQRLPSDGGGEEDYEDDEGGEVRRSKMRTFFLRGKLRKSSDTRSSTSLGSESSESSSRGGSLSPTAGISVVVSDLSNSPSNSSNLTVDSPDHTADTSPKLSPLRSEYGDEAGEITIAVPLPTVCVNGSHAYDIQPPDPGSGKPVDFFDLRLLQKSLPLSVSLQNLSPHTSSALPKGPAGDRRRWSFDKPDEEEKAAIAAALEKSGPMLGDEEEPLEQAALHKDAASSASASSSTAELESQGKKQRRNLFSHGRSESAGKGQSQSKDESEQAPAATEEKHRGWFGSKDSNCKPSSRPPISQLFPHSAPTAEVSIAGSDPERRAKVEKRPLPPVPTEGEKPFSKKSANPFTTAGEQDSEWDESFEAFAAGRLQSPEDLTTDCKTQQNTPSDHPLEHCNNKGASLPVSTADQNTNVNEALHHQPCTDFIFQAQKSISQVANPNPNPNPNTNTNTNTHHFDTFAQFLETIPEHTSFENENLTLNLAACTDTNQANSASNTPDTADTNMHQTLSSVKLNSSSPDPGSSGLGSLAEEDFLSCLSSYSDKFSASSSEETEAQNFEGSILSFDKSPETAAVERLRPSESEDDFPDSSGDLSFVGFAQNTVIQDKDGDMFGFEESLESQPVIPPRETGMKRDDTGVPRLAERQPNSIVSLQSSGDEMAETRLENQAAAVPRLPVLLPTSNVSLQSEDYDVMVDMKDSLSPELMHQQPEVAARETGPGGLSELSEPAITPNISLQSDDKHVEEGEFDAMTPKTPDRPTPPSLHIITSSPDPSSSDPPIDNASLEGRDTHQQSLVPFELLGDFLDTTNLTSSPSRGVDDTLLHTSHTSDKSNSSFFQSLYVSTDSQAYQTCVSEQSSKCYSGSDANETLNSANLTIVGELSAGASFQQDDSTNAFKLTSEESSQKNQLGEPFQSKTATLEPASSQGNDFLSAASNCNTSSDPRKLALSDKNPSIDSQAYQTCVSEQSSKCYSRSGSNEILNSANLTIVGELSGSKTTAGASSQQYESTNAFKPTSEGICQKDQLGESFSGAEDKTATLEPASTKGNDFISAALNLNTSSDPRKLTLSDKNPSIDSQAYQTCVSEQSSKCYSGSGSNETLNSANLTIIGELGAGASFQQDDSTNACKPMSEGICQKDPLGESYQSKMATLEPASTEGIDSGLGILSAASNSDTSNDPKQLTLLSDKNPCIDSQAHQTCVSDKPYELSSGSEPNKTPNSADFTLWGELSGSHVTAGVPLDEDEDESNNTINEGSIEEAEDKASTPVPTRDDFGWEILSSYPKQLSEGGSDGQEVVSCSTCPQEQGATLHRCHSEGTLTPAFEQLLLPSFGSDPGAIQESSAAQPPPDLSSLTSFPSSLTSDRSTSPVALSFLPSFANATASSSAAQEPMLQGTNQQRQATGDREENSPHPVKPLTTAIQAEEKRTEGRSVLATGLEKLKSTIHPGRSSQVSEPETERRKSLTEGAGSYYHLNHSELVALLVQREADLERQKAVYERQKLLLAKREVELRKLKPQVKDLEDYIDTLLVRIMEQKPTLLQVRSKLK
ncbi:dentin sialophosphoprotein isoform X2 [Notolabrus celidotus]|uniref:dentin sialophosphoprotein isoform X2 n=1 Tax=Notolabrus celidotus TaxID=1203425 RepID=UPI00148F50A5|nr:dentin sialophosphoprotein isoform X2 [Notolabrus celidotus]